MAACAKQAQILFNGFFERLTSQNQASPASLHLLLRESGSSEVTGQQARPTSTRSTACAPLSSRALDEQLHNS